MSDQTEFLRECIVNIVSDNYENFETVLYQISQLGEIREIAVNEIEVCRALEWALSEGLVEAYMLSPHERQVQKTEYSSTKLRDLWYHITPFGRTAQKSILELSGEEY